MKTVIMAGGRGTRLQSVTNCIPKPMVSINGIPVLERELIELKEQGLNDIIITISYLGNVIKEYFGDGSRLGINIEYFEEVQPLGNAGALFELRDKLRDDFLLINGDVVFSVDFNRMLEFHKEHMAMVTLFTHPNAHPYDSGLIITEDDGSVKTWLAKEDKRPRWYKNRVNAGLHIISPRIFDYYADRIRCGVNDCGEVQKVDLDRDLLKPLAGTNLMFCYDSPEYVKDMGTPDRLERVVEDYCRNIVLGKRLSNRQKAIFLDRDGTLNKYVGFLKNIDDLELLDGVADAIRKINQSEYLAIIITNQPVIARGEVTEEELNEIHNKLETLLGNEGAYIDAIYYCPHHPDSGYKGEIKEFKIECDCRKPKAGLLYRAAEKFNIDLQKSWMVGDSNNDILAGNRAGCHTCYVGNSNCDGYEIKCDNLLSFVNELLN